MERRLLDAPYGSYMTASAIHKVYDSVYQKPVKTVYQYLLKRRIGYQKKNLSTKELDRIWDVVNSSFMFEDFKKRVTDRLYSYMFIGSDFIDSLHGVRLCDVLDIKLTRESFGDIITITGPWNINAIVKGALPGFISEIINLDTNKEKAHKEGKRTLDNLISFVSKNIRDTSFKFFDNGTHCKFSHSWHAQAIDRLSREIPNNFIGTTNIHLSEAYDLRPIGIPSMDWTLGFQSLSSQKDHLLRSCQSWNGLVGMPKIFVGDSYKLKTFLNGLTPVLADKMDAIVISSGDEYGATADIIDRFMELGIDPSTKMVIYTKEGMTIYRASSIFDQYKSMINMLFGISSPITNDVGATSVEMDYDMVNCNGSNVSRVTDTKDLLFTADSEQLNKLNLAMM